MEQKELNDWQSQVHAMALQLCPKLLNLCESMDLDPDLAIDALPDALAYALTYTLIEEDQPRVLDQVVRELGEDFVLTLRKVIAHDAPDRVSAAFKLETGRIDRELKRRRHMPNAPAPGEA